MHNFTHSLAHRAPPASRTRGRWQPYAALQSTSASTSSASSSTSSTFSARASPANYLTNNTTPATSATSSPACEVDPSRLKDSASRDGNRTKYALNLVDQSVKSLCDIWRPQDIPAVYSSPKAPESLQTAFAQQRFSKGTASSILATHNLLTTASQPCVPTAPVLLQTGTSEVPTPLVPVRGFVHEVLRRSRTSGGVLQTALCYLEAIRPKLANLIQEEKAGTALRGEPEPTSTITVATEAELAMEAELGKADTAAACSSSSVNDSNNNMIDTVRIDDDCELSSPFVQTESPEAIAPPPAKASSSAEVSPLPALPSPLLCPRRAFLAALILASKFTQDKCYSNRAWAKLSGLSPREIGRCERALGNALDWRLWVGKAAVPAAPATQKPVSRSQSEPSIVVTPPTPATSMDTGVSAVSAGLRRASTLPSGAFTPPNHFPVETKERSYSTDCSLYLQPTAWKQDGVNSNGSSPLSDVPSLTYSPSSTESSSSGERTIQMSTFLEDNMVPPGVESTQSWPWLESDGSSGSFSSSSSVDGTAKAGLAGSSAAYLPVSSSPVAKINGKLLTGNGLQGFQNKRHRQSGYIPVGSFGDLSGVAHHANQGVCVFDPTSQPYPVATEGPSMSMG